MLMPTTDDQRDPVAAAAPVTDPDAPVTDPDATVPDYDRQPAGRREKSWRQLMVVVVAAIVLMLLIKAFIVQVYRIPSASMEDTLLTGDRVLVNKLVYHVRGIARGDIVVFSGQGSWGTTTGAPDPDPPASPLVRARDSPMNMNAADQFRNEFVAARRKRPATQALRLRRC